eukprot:scaffold2404_cov398-Prasinococcus_capsulatus_cf.AAC.9
MSACRQSAIECEVGKDMRATTLAGLRGLLCVEPQALSQSSMLGRRALVRDRARDREGKGGFGDPLDSVGTSKL